MTTTALTTKTSYNNAKKIVDSVLNGDTNLYAYIGRPQPWSDENEVPPDVQNDLSSEYDVWYDMTAMKKVIDQDIRLGFLKISWVEDTVYEEYSHDKDLSALNFYVYTDEKKVYKCISNNNDSPSTQKPIHTTTNIVKTSDGYKWKYMFTLSDSLIRKFAVGDYLPISSDSFIQSQATIGSIDHLKLISGGSGYALNALADNETEIPIYVLGDGDENATATCNLIVTGGVVQGASIVNAGSNYPYAPESNIPVMIRQITSTGAVETAFGTAITGTAGQLLEVVIVKGGSGYTSGQASIVQSSCYGYAETDSVTGTIINVEIATSRAGSNFRKAKAIVVANGITDAEVKPIISPFAGHGASPEKELFAKYVLINLNFAYGEGEDDFTIQNDFRRIGLIENPLNFGTDDFATARTLNAKPTLEITNITGSFLEDDIIYGQTSGAKGIHVDLIEGKYVRYIKDDNILSNNIDFTIEQIASESGAAASIINIINPEVEPYSGDILFINNRTPIDRTGDQIETVTLVLEY
jgi:hypothetical protein